METMDAKDTSQCVRVAVNIRPLVTSELLIGCTDCVTVVPGEPQVQIGSHVFTFDYVFGNGGYASSRIFDECVAPLVDALFQGYNGTVLAYGQTGSGKTYTMGTNYNGEEQTSGVIPMVMNTIFSRAEAMKESTEFLIRVSFIEIFKEEVFDLLDQNGIASCKADGAVKPTGGPARVPIQIRETVHGGITLAGVTEAEVRTKEEMACFLLRGSVARATGSTKMNSQSSRSHAIFTISLEQKRVANCSSGSTNDDGDDILCAKLHLVDLAGSERAKRTGADDMRLREGIHINKGLLALGNVISALGDEKKRKEGAHIPYRDSKLTRLLQDSLGGNSKTVMIACVSPADTNAEETLNTLKYANRARNIQNKAIVNRDPMAAQMQRMRSQIEQLQAELLYVRGDSGAPFEELQILKSKISLLEASNAELQKEVKERRIRCEQLTQSAIDAQVERDRLMLKIESSKNGRSWNEIDNSDQDLDLVKKYISKIQELEAEVLHLQSSTNSKHGEPVDYLGLDYGELLSKGSCSEDSDIKSVDTNGEAEVEEKELEHSSLQEKLDMELKELDKKLEQKEAEMKRFAAVDTSVLKQHYEKKVHELELEKKALQKEIESLQRNLSNISSNSDESAQKLKEDYLQKLNLLESQVAVLKKKQDAQSQLLRQKQKSDDAAKRLQDEIHRIKTQKVQLQQKIKQESEQFRLWKASREKEVLQLKKEGRRNEYEMHKLLALNQRQKMVLQRKTEEAAMATKRLKELLESRKTSRDMAGSGSTSAAGFQALMQAIEHELEVTVRVHEVRSEYERQMQERAKMANEVAELKLKTLSDCPQKMSPGARNSRIFALENMLATSSSTLVSMASQLSEAEERERTFSGRGRWNQVRSLADAKNIMNFLFNLASSSRCQLRDREVECREKDAEIRELKEKVVNLVRQLELQKSELRQLESQNSELIQQEKLMKLALEHPIGRTDSSVSNVLSSIDGHDYDLRQKGNRSSLIYSSGWNKTELEEDMDTSDSDCSYQDKSDTDYGLVCCSCSKKSLCKTNRCECRAVGGSCGASCGCDPIRCSNKETSTKSQLPSLDVVGDEGNTLATDEAESNQTLASQGAMLLQNALSEKPTQSKDEGETKRKPLSDIGNTRAKANVPKPNQRKKWRKSVIQLVPAAPTTQASNADAPIKTSQSGNADTSVKTENNVGEIDTPPLKLPRAMRSALTNGNTLRERNSETNGSVVDLTTPPAPKSPLRQAKASDEKEN
ncbi:Kinesin-like protein KIN-4C [Datura stramonium]|uniref:Kinesin-like protein KIN-4C n=1 Tax=Datura stramonium TaxID=4076 RepID=A0ABS8S7R8_DATST|nr:Kinesin-like protein KIN-4C [Datura stramonium]